MDIAEKIKYIRVNIADESQQVFASKVDVTRNTIKNWESGISKPTINHIICISLIYNISTNFLIFDGADEELCLYGLGDDEYKLLSDMIKIYRNKGLYAKE